MKNPLRVLLATALAGSLSAQTVPGSTSAAAAAKDETITLSPFEVRPDEDIGYQAINTTSGSRLSTNLKDTAASISPFTAEFLSDIAATNVSEMLNYAANAELNAGDSEGSGFNNPRDFSSAGGEPFRIRGIPGGVSTDYVENATPQDLYNIERAEVASGANSILFGSGDAGGLVSLSSKKANVARHKYTAQAQFGSWHYQRYTTDLNRVLIPKTLAVRLNALYGNAQTWRRYEYNDPQRAMLGATYKPFQRTTFSANFEKGLIRNSVGLKWNTTDQVTRWLALGRPLTSATATNAATATANFGANQRYTFIPQDGIVTNLRNTNRSNIAPSVTDTLLPPSVFPYDVNWAGPSARLWRNFHNSQFSLEHHFTESLIAQASYFRNSNDARSRSFVYNTTGGNTMDFFGDPNPTLPSPTGTGTIPNPHAGQLYLEANHQTDSTVTNNEIKRLMLYYELKLGKWFGHHRLAGMYEKAVQNRHNWSTREILVDVNRRPVANATPENGQNLLWRRTYVTEGSHDTYALLGLFTPVPPFVTNGSTLYTREIVSGEIFSVKDVKSYMLAAQSSWWNGKLTSTLGYRRDDIVYLDTSPSRTPATDPRVGSGEKLLNEVMASSTTTQNTFTADTLTAGGVFHLTNRFSVFGNTSTNHGAPRFDRRILPDGRIPPPPKGNSKDGGIMIDLLGDDRFFARFTYFETAQIGDAAVSPSGAVADAAALGRSQTKAITAALVQAGRMTQAQADAETFNWNAAIIDTTSKGWEAELIANPTRNWTVRANYSHSLRDRENFFAEGYAWFAERFTEWRAAAASNPTLASTVETNITAIQQNELDGRAVAQEQGFGSIPHKATLTTRYKLGEGLFSERLKGSFVGGAIRYQSGAFSQKDTRTGQDYWTNKTIFTDAFAGYRFKLPWHARAQGSVQLNVRNLTNSYLATTARWNADFSGARRIYLRDPRSYRLTFTVEY